MAADTQSHRDICNDAVIAATCLGGQPSAARTMIGLRDNGPVAVTPHIVPQCSLHSMASAASVGFGMHGPNFGVGGGPHATAEGFLLALTCPDAGKNFTISSHMAYLHSLGSATLR